MLAWLFMEVNSGGLGGVFGLCSKSAKETVGWLPHIKAGREED